MSLTLTRRYNVDRFGYLIPYRYGNLPMLGAVATFRPGEGRFGRGAVAVEEGTTNLFVNPTLSSEAERWTKSNSTVENYDGYVRITTRDTYAGVYQTVGMQEEVTYTLSYWYRHVSGATVVGSHIDGWNESNIQIRIDKGPWIAGNVINVPDDSQFHFIEVRYTSTSSGSKKVYLQPGRGRSGATTGDIRTGYGFGVQLEAKPFATSFVDGTRANGKLEYDINLPAENFTIAHWLRVPNDIAPLNGSGNTWLVMYNILNDSGFSSIVSIGHWGNFSIYYGHNFYLYLPYPDDTEYGDWVYMVIVKQGRTMTMYAFNATRDTWSKKEATIPEDDSGWTTITQLKFRGVRNILHDELLILPYAASEEEIRAWYEADGPIPPHPDALLQWDWKAVRPATMVAL